MNFSIIRYILGWVLKLEGAFLLLPCLTALIYQEKEGFVYLGVSMLCLLIGFIMAFRKPKSNIFYLKEGCVTTSLCWIVMSIFGALPFRLTGEFPTYTDALFEIISGFTTTGASVLSDVEVISHCTTLWRCFSHWIGGMGVLVFLLAIIPMTGGSHINLMRAESPGPVVGKIVPKIRHTARILYLIYVILTIIQLVLLLFGGMPFFEALNTAFATAGTGGFGIKNDSFASYSPYLQWVTAIFMFLFAVNFNVYYLVLLGKFKSAFQCEELRWFFSIVLIAIGIITLNIQPSMGGWFEALTAATFQVTTLISSTGFASANFDLWPALSKTVLILCMVIGACAGSTGGGLKVSRVVIMFKSVLREFQEFIHPKSIRKIKFEGKDMDETVVNSIGVYLSTFVLIFGASLLIVSLNGESFTTNFTAVLATFNNIGPGLDAVGPTCNYGHLSDLTKYVLMFDMLAGRLELFPLLILFHPGTWKGITRHARNANKK